MALELMQGFDYSTWSDLAVEGYVVGGSGTPATGMAYAKTASGQGLFLDTTSGARYIFARSSNIVAITASTLKVVGAAFYINSTINTTCWILAIEATSGAGASIRVNANGSVSIMSGGTVLGTSTTGIVTTTTWFYAELKVSSTAAVVQINGAVALSLSGLSLGTTFNRVDIGSSDFNNTSGVVLWVDDLYILNGTGAYNDFLSTPFNIARIQTLKPTGTGNYIQWTPNTGTNYGAVGETTEDADTSYVNAGTVGLRDSYTHAALSGTIAGIIGIDEVMYAKNDPASTGTHSIAQSIRIGGVDYDATAQNLGASYAYLHNTRTTSPATSAAFTATEINGMEFGQKVAS